MSARRITRDAIAAAQKLCDDAPACVQEDFKIGDAVRMCTEHISRLRSKGYDWPQISNMLATTGFVISANCLQTYLSQDKAAGKRRKNRRPAEDLAQSNAPATRVRPRELGASPSRAGRQTDGVQRDV